MTDALAEIRTLYYRASKATITSDFERAIDLLKSMETEEERERATVYMQGLAEMRSEWQASGTKLTRHEAKPRRPKR